MVRLQEQPPNGHSFERDKKWFATYCTFTTISKSAPESLTMADAPIPKMSVKDSGGEVSASIEETNRVRAKLGLKPLSDGAKASDPDAVAVANAKELAEEKRRAAEEEAMRTKLDDARRQRLLNAKLGGKSIGEQLEGAPPSFPCYSLCCGVGAGRAEEGALRLPCTFALASRRGPQRAVAAS